MNALSSSLHISLIFLFCSLFAAAEPVVWFVTPDGVGGGSSWQDAGALHAVMDTASPGDAVWVGAGIYRSTTSSVLAMAPGVSIFGGFSGTETQLSERNWRAHPTVIDGESARRCVIGANEARLDGFTIRNGFDQNEGGGMWNHEVSVVVKNCSFEDNVTGIGLVPYPSSSAAGKGAGIYTSASSLHAINCVFLRNWAREGNYWPEPDPEYPATPCPEDYCYRTGGSGGAVRNDNGSSSVLENCVFISNNAGQGSAVHNYFSSMTVAHCSFYGNISYENDGPERGHVLGSLHYWYLPESFLLVNSIVWGNTATQWPVAPNVSVSHSCIQGGYGGLNNLDADPHFFNPGSLDLRLRALSPCIDAGMAEDMPNFDLDGRPRPNGAGYDMGAYEYYLCDPDSTAPVIGLKGEPLVLVNCHAGGYTEVGLDAWDDCDGDLTLAAGFEDTSVRIWASAASLYENTSLGQVEAVFNGGYVSVPGEYTLVYRVADSAGNENTATRQLTVVCDPLEGEGEDEGESEGESQTEGEGEKEGESEGEPLSEGEDEGEGEFPVEGEEEGEGEGEAEGETPIEGENEGETGCVGCFRSCIKINTPHDSQKYLLGDWLLVGVILLALLSAKAHSI